ncbi:MAG: hypothetical protein A3F94_02810 [Candidatus Spechtbacteria bacterium RIFCSPLOWO2_12_FULL_38_22]|uniref:Uncharacterized protein n=1 Tax=Candidatus Spechtbacteria bacterium RIFCSPLOWO2_12_FULL_38_22 TaxID=1802165 RepID=A0A1G2HIF7_9BACT|nr:MAG: hypothetical protein A3E58_01850 [Candidatus Spechtbacteria bacterium RIFCSPHIGHO2_12_FULL_38_30]OGZ62233.1 MAG: hypothetical protein A3F94_02810 [Candidatus Spechtbacteria bacterium RIFCSPLOWO2_12_FULL_38_22]
MLTFLVLTLWLSCGYVGSAIMSAHFIENTPNAGFNKIDKLFAWLVVLLGLVTMVMALLIAGNFFRSHKKPLWNWPFYNNNK